MTREASILHDLGLMLQREERTPARMEDGGSRMVSVCAWCEQGKPVAERNRGANVSHGICARHKQIMEAQLEALRRVA